MIGLVKKDLLCIRKSAVSFVWVAVIYIILTIAGIWDVNVLAAFFAMIISMLPYTIFALDHASKWDIYAITFPLSRRKIVLSRYLTLLVVLVFAFLIAGITGIFSMIQGVDIIVSLLSAFVVQIYAVIFNSLMLPLLYRFGAERARIVFFGVFGGIVLLTLLAYYLLGGVSTLEALFVALSHIPPGVLIIGAVLLCAAVLFGSYRVSVFFYEQKEW